ncbi:unnamed protein product [Rotaria magnacalcarata]|uniref:Uncharacterized protein n=1 Tax=Rotaria magnacalcarata TaxID=392030 RepID=A0A816MIL0_9BILA|nr:unnamed protein product [Rotaria magnacalcarata]
MKFENHHFIIDTTSKVSSGRSLAKGQTPLIMHLYNESSSLESQTTSIATHALVITNQAPDKALFNIVERCLPSMSHDLAGLILIYDHFGKHLNDTELTEHTELEKENFKVTEVWSINVFDEYPVVAEYINPLQFTDDQWKMVDSTLALNICVEEAPLYQRVNQTRSISTVPKIEAKNECNIDEYWCATYVLRTQYTIPIILILLAVMADSGLAKRPYQMNFLIFRISFSIEEKEQKRF